MRKFDLEAFKNHKKDNTNHCRYNTINAQGDNVEIYLIEHNDCYQESIIYLNTPIKKRYKYDKKTLNLTKEIESFYDCVIGFQREYNEQQELIKEINHDKPYPFSWQDLVQKMKHEYGINLMDEKDQIRNNNYVSSLSRSFQLMKYFIDIPCTFIPHGIREEKFEIDASTGRTLFYVGNRKKIN
ncbi:hypothetical protein [Flavobacterium sp.]|uniref:hypothetical protein n=1 Tax=Flavobacterium sp. TaxID=239 RepID=UPI003D0B83CE